MNRESTRVLCLSVHYYRVSAFFSHARGNETTDSIHLTFRLYSQDRFMNPGPAPRPPVTTRLNYTPAVNNVPGNASTPIMSPSNVMYTSSNSSLKDLSKNGPPSQGALAVIKEGWARVKEEGFIKGVFWNEKWLVLRETQLDFHKTTNSPKISFTITLKDVTAVTRSENYPYSFEISRLANPGSASGIGVRDAAVKTLICKLDTDDEVYEWIDRIYERCPNMGGVSNPTNFLHQVHVGFDQNTGGFVGLPPEWEKLLTNSAISQEDYKKNPQAVIEVLDFYQHKVLKKSDDGNLPLRPSYSNESSSSVSVFLSYLSLPPALEGGVRNGGHVSFARY